MTRLNIELLPSNLAEAARSIATTLHAAGFQAWLVGGAVRDLALGLQPADIDITTDALPEQVEAVFEHTTAVGRAFGTIVVRGRAAEAELEERGMDVEVTTFRCDGAYKDGRHPEDVTYGTSVEDDARRRDFTCNALYLDPLSQEFRDPEHGLDDLLQGRLRCVGEARRRFEEDGLRLLRLVRFEARFGLQPVEETLAGARAARRSLVGVSAERVLAELRGIFASADPARAFERLLDLELLELAVPDFSQVLGPAESPAQRLRLLVAALRELGGHLSLELGLALLLEPDPTWALDEERFEQRRRVAKRGLLGLHPSRKTRQAVLEGWRDRRDLQSLLEVRGPARSERLRRTRRDSWALVERASHAWLTATGAASESLRALAALHAERESLSPEELFPAPLLTPEDLAAAGITRGPRWAELLEAAEVRQLDDELADRAAALDWLASQSKAAD